jgi:hypothetical protein
LSADASAWPPPAVGRLRVTGRDHRAEAVFRTPLRLPSEDGDGAAGAGRVGREVIRWSGIATWADGGAGGPAMAAGGSVPVSGPTGNGDEGIGYTSARPSAGPRVPLIRTATSRHATTQITAKPTHTIV